MNHEPLKNKLVDKYPEDIFIEPTKEQWEKIHELCNKEIGKSFDGFAGSISRRVLRNCIKDVKSAVEGYKNSLQKHLEEAKNSLSTEGYFDGYIDGIQLCINEIDKRFEDVIE